MSALRETQVANLLIVDDDASILSQLQLGLDGDFEVSVASDAEAAWELVQQVRPSVVTLDLALDGKNPETGFSLLERLLKLDPFLKIVLITGNDDEPNALRAIDQGAADFLGKPVDVDELSVVLRRLHARGLLERQNAAILQELGDERRLGSILGSSSEIQLVFETIRRVASADVSVLILGESGTGKELAAREIRRLSPRSTKPFVNINCGAIPENLLESELFGHEKGSFTGAHVSRAGRLEMANEGIVFLDEVAELPVQLQVKLLQFLQDHEIERVGGRTRTQLDVRVIAATNRDLHEEVKKGNFREDLYYRLSVVNVWLPPLRERQEDVLFLARYFLSRFSKEHDRGAMKFTAQASAALSTHAWPGNVRELENNIQRAVVMSRGHSIDAVDLGLPGAPGSHIQSLREAREATDRRVIIEALENTRGNVSKASRALGISRPSLHEIMQKLGINARSYRKPRTKSSEAR
jgi:two-component system NtrC family response regulator